MESHAIDHITIIHSETNLFITYWVRLDIPMPQSFCTPPLHPSPPRLQALPLVPVGCFQLLSLCSQPLRIVVELSASLSCLSISSLALGPGAEHS